jgi:hypothetical protein
MAESPNLLLVDNPEKSKYIHQTQEGFTLERK